MKIPRVGEKELASSWAAIRAKLSWKEHCIYPGVNGGGHSVL